MKIQPYIEKLQGSQEYKKFQEENKDAYLVAGFFVLDFDTEMNVHQIDYYLPSQKKVAAFTLDAKVEVRILETMNEKVPEKLDLKTNVDLDALKGILEDEMKNRNITENIKKIIAVIQTLEGKKVWILNCILSGMEILKAHVEDESQTVLSMEKASILEYIKKAPPQALGGTARASPSKEEIEKQIEQLDKVKDQLEKEKAKAKPQDEETKPQSQEDI
jgi:hypothetical protein